MPKNKTWRALQRQLEGGTVLRHVNGFSKPVAVGRDCQFHEHAEIELVFHPTGSGVTRMQEGAEVAFAEGDAVVYAPGVRHDQRATESGVDCCVQIHAPASVRLDGHLHLGRLEDVVLRSELEYLSSRSPGGSAAGDALLNLRTTSVMLQLLEMAFARTNSEASKLERRVLAAERYVKEHYATIGAVSEIARASGVGPDHLRHIFRKQRGKSLIAYLAEVRLTRARSLLAYASLPIKEIARLCGYRDEYYFSTVFRKKCGCAPGQYREHTRSRKR